MVLYFYTHTKRKEAQICLESISKKDRIIFFGNTAGYIDGNTAVVDPMFYCGELNDFLKEKQRLNVEWEDGIYDRLANPQ